MDLISYILSKKAIQNLKDSLGGAAYLNVPAEGYDAADDEVVLGRDSRLNTPQPPAHHTHPLADITNAGTAAAYNIPLIGDATNDEVVMGDDSRLTNSRDPNPHTHLKTDITDFAHTHTLSDISDVPENSGAEYSVPIIGDAGNNELVLGDDSRLSNNRDPNPHVHSLLDITNAGTSAALDYSNIVTAGDDTHLVTSKAVADAIAALPEPMVFKGSLGVGGTISDLPIDGSATKGDTYKVITAGTYAGQVSKIGDTFICDSKTLVANTWIYIPSGDEPSGTVISVGASAGNNGVIVGTNVGNNNPITESGIISVSHADTSSQTSTDNSGRTYIQNITLDDYGHVTALSSATETVVDTNTTYTFDSGDNNGEIKIIPSEGSSYNVSVTGLGPAAFEATEEDILDKITSSQITTALGYIPYNSTNPNGYTSNIGTVTQVKIGNTGYDPVSGIVSLPDYPTVPTKVSELTNDAGYITSYVNTTYSLSRDSTSIKLTPSSGTAETVSLDSLLTNLPSWTATPTDDTYLIRRDTAGGASYGQVKFSTIWSYIDSKVSAAGYTKNTGTVTSVKVGSTSYSPSSGVVSLPAYPTTLPASDVYSWAKASTKPSYTASEVGALASTTKYAASESVGGASKKVYGYYTGSGGVQPPNYFGTNAVGFLMSNVTLSSDSHYKNIMYMDCYSGTDVGGTTAFAIDRTEARAWILQADKNRTAWNDTAELITSKNIASQSVSSATTASKLGSSTVGSATQPIYLNGGTATACTYTLGKSVPSDAVFTDHTYNFSGTSFTSNNSTGKNANDITYNAHTYYTSNGPATSLGASANDGALYSQAYSTSWVAQIAQDYRNGGLYVRGKNNGTWQSWYKVWDSRNLTNLNQLTNGPGYITSSGSCASATKATQDGSGNTITSTYLKLSGGTMTGTLTTKALEASGTVNIGTASAPYNVVNANDVRAYRGLESGKVGSSSVNSVAGHLYLYPDTNKNTNYIDIRPASGTLSSAVATIYVPLKAGTIALTSDLSSYTPLSPTAVTITKQSANHTMNSLSWAKKIGKMVYFTVVINGNASYLMSGAVVKFSNVTANGRHYFFGYVSKSATDFSFRSLYIDNGSDTLAFTEGSNPVGYSLVVSGSFICN